MKQVLRFVQRVVEETPEMTGATIALDDADIERLLADVAARSGLPAARLDAVPGLIVAARGETAAELPGPAAAAVAEAEPRDPGPHLPLAGSASPAPTAALGPDPVTIARGGAGIAAAPLALPEVAAAAPEPEATQPEAVAEAAPETPAEALPADEAATADETWPTVPSPEAEVEAGTMTPAAAWPMPEPEPLAGPGAAAEVEADSMTPGVDWPEPEPARTETPVAADSPDRPEPEPAFMAATPARFDAPEEPEPAEIAAEAEAPAEPSEPEPAGLTVEAEAPPEPEMPEAPARPVVTGAHADVRPAAVFASDDPEDEPVPPAEASWTPAAAHHVDVPAPADPAEEADADTDDLEADGAADDWEIAEPPRPAAEEPPAPLNIFAAAPAPRPADEPAEADIPLRITGTAAAPDPVPDPREEQEPAAAMHPQSAPEPEPEPGPEPVETGFNIFAAAGTASPAEPPAPPQTPPAPPADAEPDTATLRRRLFGDAAPRSRPVGPDWIEDPDEPAPETAGTARSRLHGGGSGDAGSPLDGIAPEDLAARAGAATVPDLLAASAAWLTLVERRSTFGRREVMEVFDRIPGDHPRTLEARIKGYGRLVRNGSLILVEDGRFALSQDERERFGELIG